MVRSITRSPVLSLGLVCVALLLMVGIHQVRGEDFDPQSLIGEWQGTWSLMAQRGVTGNYYITIKKVDGEKVYGRSERPATTRTAESNWGFVGTLAGNVLTVKNADFIMELTVNGKTMAGWALIRGNRNEVSLTKK